MTQPKRRVGESIQFGEGYRGERTWYIPPTENTYCSGLPDGVELSDLSPAELKAAIDLRIVSPASIDQEVVQSTNDVTRKQAAKAARSLLEKIIGARPE